MSICPCIDVYNLSQELLTNGHDYPPKTCRTIILDGGYLIVEAFTQTLVVYIGSSAVYRFLSIYFQISFAVLVSVPRMRMKLTPVS